MSDEQKAKIAEAARRRWADGRGPRHANSAEGGARFSIAGTHAAAVWVKGGSWHALLIVDDGKGTRTRRVSSRKYKMGELARAAAQAWAAEERAPARVDLYRSVVEDTDGQR